jgi:hypothetical protein
LDKVHTMKNAMQCTLSGTMQTRLADSVNRQKIVMLTGA